MTVTIVGGLEKLRKGYEKICKEKKLKPKFIMDYHPNLKHILSNSDLIVLITSHINHNAAKVAKSISKERGIPLFLCHNGSVNSFKRTLEICNECIHKNNCSFYKEEIKNINLD